MAASRDMSAEHSGWVSITGRRVKRSLPGHKTQVFFFKHLMTS